MARAPLGIIIAAASVFPTAGCQEEGHWARLAAMALGHGPNEGGRGGRLLDQAAPPHT
jgi:hypothetical protein